MTTTIHPGAFVQLTTGPYKTVLWGDEVNIPAFMVERIEGETVHCYFPPYSFQWPLSDLVAVDRPAEYGSNHDDWISEARSTFTYATEYESEYDDE